MPFQETAFNPAPYVFRARARTSAPFGVSTRTLTRADRVCRQEIRTRRPRAGRATLGGSTRRNPTVELTEKRRVALEPTPWSSVAATVNVQRPSFTAAARADATA